MGNIEYDDDVDYDGDADDYAEMVQMMLMLMEPNGRVVVLKKTLARTMMARLFGRFSMHHHHHHHQQSI